jgi:hypothetical protein
VILFIEIIFLILMSFQTPSFASVQLGSPKILVAPPEPQKTESLDDANINTDTLLKLIEEVVSRDHPEMFDRWQKYLRSQNLDPENEDRTLKRLQQKYLDSIQSWGAQVSDCDSSRSSGRWLRRLKRKFGADEVALHKKEIAKIITSLYLKRKTECMQTHEEAALRAEREIYAFSLERTRLLIDFISQNSEMRISQLNKYRLLSSLKRKQTSHTLGDRTVDINSLRLETKLQNLPKLYVDFLAHEQSFKKPFDLHKNLSLLSSEYDEKPVAKKPSRRAKKQPDLNMKSAS